MPTDSHAADATALRAGDLSLDIEDGAVRAVAFQGVEVVRLIDCSVRDADWRTLALEQTSAETGPGLAYRRRFRTEDGAFRGSFELAGDADAGPARLDVRLELVAEREAVVNRAGLVLLHPIAGVAGEPVEVVHPDGSVDAARFPDRIAPSQPVFDIAGLRHRVGPVAVEIAMEGEVFEMEDQRNWTDASFKTYCRPLAWPSPFTVSAGEVIRQRTIVTLRADGDGGEGDGGEVAAGPGAVQATMPEIALAHEAALCGALPRALARLEAAAVLVRVDAGAADLAEEIGPGPVRAPVTLEIVTGAKTGPEAEADIARAKAACAAAGVLPARVVALPRAYLASHEPEGPWPDGPKPMDLVPMLRAAFPEAEVGGGMLTYFTEFNRCPPDSGPPDSGPPDSGPPDSGPPDSHAIDFATFGTTAIVHAADDRSVVETLEALGDVFTSARALVGAKALRLGLVSIGMRSNPYGSAVAANPEGKRVPMAMADPRQRALFGAAWGVAAAAAAARSGVASFAPAMTGGPLGLGADGALWPIYHAVAALAALADEAVEVAGGPASGVVSILGQGRRGVRGIVANLGPEPADYTAPDQTAALVLDATSAAEATRDPGWIEGEGQPSVRLERFAVAVLRAR